MRFMEIRRKLCINGKWRKPKRDALPPRVVQRLDWSSRSISRMCLAGLDPSFLSHQECHICRKLVKDPKKCSACGIALYCSKECQVTAWKSGHKQECKKAKEDRKREEEEKKQKQAAISESRNLPPLDLAFDPRKLWAKADKLARKKTKAQEAVFYYLVALFMDISLDAQDTQLAKGALAACDSNDPMAIALGMVISPDRQSVLKSCHEALEAIYQNLACSKCSLVDESGVESVEDIDRPRFGVAMTFIFYARIVARCFSGKSMEQETRRARQQAHEDVMTLLSSAKLYLDADRWLT